MPMWVNNAKWGRDGNPDSRERVSRSEPAPALVNGSTCNSARNPEENSAFFPRQAPRSQFVYKCALGLKLRPLSKCPLGAPPHQRGKGSRRPLSLGEGVAVLFPASLGSPGPRASAPGRYGPVSRAGGGSACEPCPEEEAAGVHGCLWESVFNSGPTVALHLSQALQASFDQ